MFIYSLHSFSRVTGGRYRIILETAPPKEVAGRERKEKEKKCRIYCTLSALVLKELSVDTYEKPEMGEKVKIQNSRIRETTLVHTTHRMPKLVFALMPLDAAAVAVHTQYSSAQHTPHILVGISIIL